MSDDKNKGLIEKQIEIEKEMKQVREDYINDMESHMKQITVKIFLNTHKMLKINAASKNTSLEKIATSIIEDKVSDLDIVEYVKNAFENDNANCEGLQQSDITNKTYYLKDKLLKKENLQKRINVKVNPEIHKKLRVISAIQDKSLDKIVGSVIEYEVEETNNIGSIKLMGEILRSVDDNQYCRCYNKNNIYENK